jgi:hypothetical protein
LESVDREEVDAVLSEALTLILDKFGEAVTMARASMSRERCCHFGASHFEMLLARNAGPETNSDPERRPWSPSRPGYGGVRAGPLGRKIGINFKNVDPHNPDRVFNVYFPARLKR